MLFIIVSIIVFIAIVRKINHNSFMKKQKEIFEFETNLYKYIKYTPYSQNYIITCNKKINELFKYGVLISNKSTFKSIYKTDSIIQIHIYENNIMNIINEIKTVCENDLIDYMKTQFSYDDDFIENIRIKTENIKNYNNLYIKSNYIIDINKQPIELDHTNSNIMIMNPAIEFILTNEINKINDKNYNPNNHKSQK
jgi:hypothetical protein